MSVQTPAAAETVMREGDTSNYTDKQTAAAVRPPSSVHPSKGVICGGGSSCPLRIGGTVPGVKQSETLEAKWDRYVVLSLN